MKIIALILSTLFTTSLLAAASTPQKGEGEFFFTLANFKAKKQYSENRKRENLFDNGTFEKTELTCMGLHGLAQSWAVFYRCNIFSDLNFNSNTLEKNNTSLGDQELGLRKEIFKTTHQVFSLQTSLSFPLYSKSKDPLPGNHQNDLELRVLWDLYQAMSLDFISAELSYRKRFKAPADQIKFDLALGKKYLNFIFIFNSFLTMSAKNHAPLSVQTNPNLRADWDNLKIGPSLAFQVTPSSHLQAGAWFDVWGRGTGAGRTLFLSWWQNY